MTDGAGAPLYEQGSHEWHMQRYNECWLSLPLRIRRQECMQIDDNPVAAGIARIVAEQTVAKTAAQRQAERKARELAAGRVQWKRWVHPDDVAALAELADKLARKRAKKRDAPT